MLPQNIFTYSTFNSCCGCIVMCVSRVARVEISQRNLGQCQSPWAGFGLASECCWCCSLLLLVAVVLLSTAIVVTLSAHWTRLDRLSWSLFHYGRSWHHSVFWVQAQRLMCKCYYCEDSSGTCIMLIECCAVMLTTNIFTKFQLFFSPPTYARMKYSTREGRLPRLLVSEGRSQPMMSSIRWEARISRTDSEEYKLKLLWWKQSAL